MDYEKLECVSIPYKECFDDCNGGTRIEVENHVLWMHVNKTKIKWNLKACIKCRPVGLC